MKRKVLYSLICAILLFSAVSVAFASVQTVKESDSIVLDESDTQKSTEDLDTLKDKLSLIPGGALEATEEQIKKWENVEPEWSKSIEFDIDNGKIFPPVRAKWAI